MPDNAGSAKAVNREGHSGFGSQNPALMTHAALQGSPYTASPGR